MQAIMLGTTHLVDWMRNNIGQDHVTQVRYGVGGKGGADLIGIRRSDGRFVACEVKGPHGRVSEEQERFLRRVVRSGGIAVVARSVGDVVAALNNSGVGSPNPTTATPATLGPQQVTPRSWSCRGRDPREGTP